MIPIVTSVEAKAIDKRIIAECGIPAHVLMENVGKEISTSILARYGKFSGKSIIVLCGGGNNGGDGFVVARNLFSYFDLRCISIGNPEKMTPETLMNYNAAKMLLGVSFIEIKSSEDLSRIDFRCDILVDALIGIQSSENIRGLSAEILHAVENIEAYKIAADIPTGLNTDSGKEFAAAFRADLVFTAFAAKQGFYLSEKIAPEVCVLDVGIPRFEIEKTVNKFAFELTDYRNSLPIFRKNASKFDFGQIAILAGSKKYPGAAALCANSAAAAGAGLVRLYSTEFHPSVVPEVIRMQLRADSEGFISNENFDFLLNQLAKSGAVAIGPGLGSSPQTIEMVKTLIDSLPESLPLVIDADGLRAVNLNHKLRKNIVLTPHIGEFSRISELGIDEVKADLDSLPREFAEKLNCVVHLKGNPAISSDGKTDYWNLNGTNALASGGSGDSLTGITAAYLGMGMNPLIAITAAAYAHARTAEIYSAQFSPLTFTASKISEYLKYI